jgi:hypothetical protein
MMEPRLQHRLSGLEFNLRRARLWRQLAFCWAATAGAALLLSFIGGFTSWHAQLSWWLVLMAGLTAAWMVWARARRNPADFRALVAAIARDNPQVRHLLATASEQEPGSESGEFRFLQLRVIEEALAHPQAMLWEEQMARKTSSARNAQFVALAAMLAVLVLAGNSHWSRLHFNLASVIGKEIEVTPGDAQLERGSGLVISVRFGRRPPPEVSLVLNWVSGKTQRLPMARNLADPVFGASLLEVAEDGLYHVEYNGEQTRDFKISVFDYPALTHADADLHYPAYTGLTNKTIRDTQRISAVEGTRLNYTLQLNEPVTRARLVGQEQSLPLALQTNAVAVLDDFMLTNSARYSLELVDADGRTNKMPAEFVFQVIPDRPPEVKIIFPRGDQRVSKLEEMLLEGGARDDFGLLKYGLGYGVAGQPPQFIELGQSAPANVQRQFTNQIALEKLGVDVDQLVSYFAWAEDYGPDGKERRTFSDIFFAEVRPFEEVFRADQSGASESQQGSQNGGRNQSPRLAELQKQIVIATWKLQKTGSSAPKENKP